MKWHLMGSCTDACPEPQPDRVIMKLDTEEEAEAFANRLGDEYHQYWAKAADE